MANPVVSGGLQLIKQANDPGELETCIVPAADNVALFIGDAVQIGTNAGPGGAQIGNYVPAAQIVQKATNSGAIYGVVMGFQPQMIGGNGSMNFNVTYRPASTAAFVLVRRVTNEDEFSIMDDGTLASGVRSALGITNIGLNANLNVSTAGSTVNGLSNMQLAGSTAATTATLQLRIVGVLPVPTNDPSAVNARWVVRVNNAVSSGGTGTAGQ